jgi:helicase MOV-10
MTAFSRPPCVPAEHSTLITFDGELDVPTYSAYFFAAVSAEIKALQAELKDFDLYQVALPHAQDPHQSTYLLGVPGLREASLRIEVGDVVQLRQVRFDMNGNVRKPLMLQDRHGQRLQNAVEKRYDSRVCNIDRLRETLTLQVDSLSQLSPFFNARFTVQNDRMDALQRAVTGAQQHLTSTANEWMRSM